MLLSDDTVFLCLEVCRGDSRLCRLWLQFSGGQWAAKSQRDRTERPHAGDNTTQVRASSTISSRWLNSYFLFLNSQVLPSSYLSFFFYLLFPLTALHQLLPLLTLSLSPSARLTAVEEELLDLARTLGSQQTSVEHLELELEAEQEGVKKGQRWVDHRLKGESMMLWCYIQML